MRTGIVVGVVAVVAVAAVVAVSVGGRLLGARKANDGDPPAASASTAPDEPPGPSVYLETRKGLIGVERGRAKIIESHLSVLSSMPARRGGLYYIARKGEVSLGYEKGMEKYIPGGKPHLYYYGGSKSETLAEVPTKDYELVGELSSGQVVVRHGSAFTKELAIADGEQIDVYKVERLARGGDDGGTIRDIVVTSDDRVLVAVTGRPEQSFLAEREPSGTWSATPLPELPPSEKYRAITNASLLETKTGLFMRCSGQIYEKKGAEFEHLAGIPPLAIHLPLMPLADGVLAVSGDRKAGYVLQAIRGGKATTLEKYARTDEVKSLHLGADGNVYVVVTGEGSKSELTRVTPAGDVAKVAGASGYVGQRTIAVDAKGRIWTINGIRGGGPHLIVDDSATALPVKIEAVHFTGGGPQELPDDLMDQMKARAASMR